MIGAETLVTSAVSSVWPGKGERPMKKMKAALLLAGVLALAMPATAAPRSGGDDSTIARLIRSVVRIVHLFDAPILTRPGE